MKNPPLELLNALVAFNESRNSAEAAEKLGLTQPAVTQQLRRLEAAMPRPLFQMSGRKKILTPFGEAVYQRARDHLQALRIDLEQVGTLYSRPDRTTIRLGGRREILMRLLPHIDFPGRIHAVNLNASEVVEALHERRIDAGISQRLPNATDLIARPLFSDTAVLIASGEFVEDFRTKHRRWSGVSTQDVMLSSDFIRSSPALLYRSHPPFLKNWLAHLRLPEDAIEFKFIFDDWITLISLAAQGKGWSIIPSSFAATTAVERVELPENVVPATHFHLLYAPLMKSAPGFKALLQSLSKAAQ